MNEDLREHLITVAKAGQVTYYSEVASIVGLDMSNPADRDKISKVLDEISSYEHENKRPLLSVVVIHKQDNIPGAGFFKLANKLGCPNASDKFMFFTNELRQTHDYWQKHTSNQEMKAN